MWTDTFRTYCLFFHLSVLVVVWLFFVLHFSLLLIFAEFFLTDVNVSQIALYHKMHRFGFRAKQNGEIGMLDSTRPKMVCLGLFALPFKFMGYSCFSGKHALRARIGHGDVR